GAVVQEGTGVAAPCRDSDGGGDAAHRDGGRVKGRWVVGDGVACAVAELAEVVLSPAAHGAVAWKRTGVEAPRGDGGGGEPGDPHRGGRLERGGARIAELAGVVPAPALYGAVGKAHAGVEAPGGESSGTADSGDRHRRRGVGRGSVAELAEVVLSPAAHGAVLKQGAAVKGAEVDRSGRPDSRRSEPL